MELIPDLPNDLARECLARASYRQFSVISSVCRGWKREVRLPEFHENRKASRHSQKLLAMAQARVDPDKKPGPFKSFGTPVYRITVLEPGAGNWTELPPAPGLTSGLPIFCRVAAVGSDIVVMGGLDPVTWKASDSVFIFSFVSGTWRRGASMPGVSRSFFGCVSDSDRTVYVAGGHDDDKNALRSVIAYDVAEDKWVPLPDMAIQRDECASAFRSGKLHVMGGYDTESQGHFMKSAESFDVATWRWGPVYENFLYAAACPRTCVAGEDGMFYACHGGDLMVRSGETWQNLGKLPADVFNTDWVVDCGEKLLVIGSAGFGEPQVGYAVDLKDFSGVKLEYKEQYSGHIQACCSLEI